VISAARRNEIVGALRRGTVPSSGLEHLAVGLETLKGAIEDELDAVKQGEACFKAVRGDYGSGKTFFGRWVQERARSRGFATSEVQVNETETPLHRLETIYRRVVEHLGTQDTPTGAFRSVIDGWFFALEQDVIADASALAHDEAALLERSVQLMEARLAEISRVAPAFSAALRAYRMALAKGDHATAEGLISWLSGQPNVAAAVKRTAGIKGDIDHFAASNFLAGLLAILKDSGYAGLLIVLDEVETLQRMRADTREKGLNALRQWIDEIDAGRFPGLYLVATGTPAFFDGAQGVQRLPPLAQRLHVDFTGEPRFDNPRAPQVRLSPFRKPQLIDVGRKVREIYCSHCKNSPRLHELVDDSYVATLADAVAGSLGGKVGIAPRIFLKKLVAEVLDKVDLFEDFDPRRHYQLTLTEAELSTTERAAAQASSVDDIEL